MGTFGWDHHGDLWRDLRKRGPSFDRGVAALVEDLHVRGLDQNRNRWHRVGKEVRKKDPGLLLRESLASAEIVGGIRDRAEMVVCRKERLVDLIVWIANDRVPSDSTVQFSERDCDVTVPNHWSLEEFYRRLLQLARFAGLPLRE